MKAKKAMIGDGMLLWDWIMHFWAHEGDMTWSRGPCNVFQAPKLCQQTKLIVAMMFREVAGSTETPSMQAQATGMQTWTCSMQMEQ